MTTGSFGVATSALSALQQAIKTTGQNIANVNTEGYSRQTVQFGTRPPDRVGGYFVGTGTEVVTIQRAFDQFLTEDVQSRTSSSAFFSSLATTAGRVDELLADPATGIGPALNDFFAAMESVSISPTTLPERQVLLGQAETLAQRFEYFDTRLSEFQRELNVQIRVSAEEINQIAESIAEVNQQIALQSAQTGGLPAGDLLDRRDQAVTELSRLIGTTPQPQDDGTIDVFIGKGQPLVVGGIASRLTVEPDDTVPNRLSVFVASLGQRSQEITSLLDGGEIGASLAAASDVLEATRRDIGVLAAGLTIGFNEVHRQGYALDGIATGIDFFSADAAKPPAPVKTTGTGTATIRAAIYDPDANTAVGEPVGDPANLAALTGDNYRLSFVSGNLTARNLTTGLDTSFAIPAATDYELVLDGVTLSIDDTANLADGDVWFLSPTSFAAANFGVEITDPNRIAAAEDPSSPGDNRNMQSLLELQDKATLRNDSSFTDFYINSTSRVAVQTRRATSLAETEASLLASAETRRSNTSGVNLEEEAANLIRFQQAFQAAAQIVSVSRDVFNSILQATSR